MSWTESQAIKYKNEFIAKNYDRINLTVPKGMKEKYKAHAKNKGLSLNAYINKLLSEDIKTESK